MQPYAEAFFKKQQEVSTQSAREVVPLILELVRPKSVIDIGCGVGAWLSVFQEQGITDILGVDGDYVDRSLLMIPKDRFIPYDLARPYAAERPFDLVMSLEVAEHLPPEGADAFVDSLIRLGPVVFFSAAVKGQGGVAHVNEQWQDYWAERFQNRGYVLVDCVRPRIWANPAVQWWYAQNSFLYVKKSCLADYPLLQQAVAQGSTMPLDVVHPRMYTGLHFECDPRNIRLKTGWFLFSQVVRYAFQRGLRKLTGKQTATPATSER